YPQVVDLRANGLDRFLDAGNLVGSEIVHHDDIAVVERGSQVLLDVRQKDFSVHGSFDHQGCRHFVAAQASHEGQRLPGSKRHAPDQSLAPRASTVKTSHAGVHRGFVNEDKAGRIKQTLLPDAAPASAGHVRPILLGCPQAFFDADAVALQKPPQRAAPATKPSLAQGRDELVKRPVRLFADQSQDLVRAALERRLAPATRLWPPSALLLPRLKPLDCRAGTDIKAFRRLT